MIQAVTYDNRSLIINGKRELIVSGEVHYPRVPRERWEDILIAGKEAGLNTIASYIFWDVHEPRPDVFDFSGQADLVAFLELCAKHGLYSILRIGPYCCAEWTYGGFPFWLREVPGITIRTYNKPYMERVEKYFAALLSRIAPCYATRGGPVILAQVENEYNNVAKRYGEDGEKYLRWVVECAMSHGIEVPLITCDGGTKGAIECVNGFTTYEAVAKVLRERPDQPGLWTENWPGWYDIWGREHHVRDVYEIGYQILRFLAAGGSGFSYYMWHGGTNFGRNSMYMATTGYDFDSPLDQWGWRTPKYHILSQLHHTLIHNAALLLEGERELVSVGGEDVFAQVWKLPGQALHALFNSSSTPKAAYYLGREYELAPLSAALISEGAVLWRSWPDGANPVSYALEAPAWSTVSAGDNLAWRRYAEPLPADRGEESVRSEEPVEQLSLTKNGSDYCWYAASVKAAKSGPARLTLSACGDYFYVYVNSELAAWTPLPPEENRGPIIDTPEWPVIPANELEEEFTSGRRANLFTQSFEVVLTEGENSIEILSCALGLIKGDWMIAQPMNQERKGLWGPVTLDGKPITDWKMFPSLTGEQRLAHDAVVGPHSLPWVDGPDGTRPLAWYAREVALPAEMAAADLNWAFDADGLDKGMAWVNGHCLGRYWTAVADGYGPDRKFHPPSLTSVGRGKPTQRYYQIAQSWLKERNWVVILSETNAAPNGTHLVTRSRR